MEQMFARFLWSIKVQLKFHQIALSPKPEHPTEPVQRFTQRWGRYPTAAASPNPPRYDIRSKSTHLPLKCFGQHTNSTPEKSEIPQGSSMAKLRICMFRSWHAAAPVWFHLMNGQHRDALWMWSNRHPSGTRRASDWKGPSGSRGKIGKRKKEYGTG